MENISIGNLDRGYTLVEILAALVIISILLFGLYHLIVNTYGSFSLTREMTAAISDAQTRVDQLTVLLWGNRDPIAVLEGENGFNDSREALFAGSGNRTGFYVERAEAAVDDKIVDGHQVTVVSFYNEGRRHIELTFFIENN